MPIYPYKCVCGDTFDVVKTMSEATTPETCPQCGSVAARLFTRFFFNGAAVQHAEYNPAFGQVVNNKYHRSELAKRNNMVEIGNDYHSPDNIEKENAAKREEKRRRNWESV